MFLLAELVNAASGADRLFQTPIPVQFFRPLAQAELHACKTRRCLVTKLALIVSNCFSESCFVGM